MKSWDALPITRIGSAPQAVDRPVDSKVQEKTIDLFDELSVPVFRYLCCLGAGADEADDIVQETFLRLYTHLQQSGQNKNLRGWIFRVAHNIAANGWKSRKRLVAIDDEQWKAFVDSSADLTPNAEESLLWKEKWERLHDALSTLSPQQAQCIHLRAEGLRYREIAECLGVTISTVVESLRRAIGKLQQE